MSGKDVLKLLLLTFGFTKIDIKTYRGVYGCIGYEIHATNDEGDCLDEQNCEGLMFNITHIIQTMKKMGIDAEYKILDGGEYSIKELLKL